MKSGRPSGGGLIISGDTALLSQNPRARVGFREKSAAKLLPARTLIVRFVAAAWPHSITSYPEAGIAEADSTR
jgi:hypothetical protein